jgi:peroxiredoxin
MLFAGGASAQESKGGSYTKIPTVKGIDTLKIGAPAPDFTVKDLDGKEFRLKECCDKDAVLLFFWSFFCGPCREEMPMINEMTRQYAGKGLQVIGVNLDGMEMKKAIDKFVASEKIAFRIVFDELDGDSFRIADPYGVGGTPALFIINRKGFVTFAAVGAVTAAALRTEIEKAAK